MDGDGDDDFTIIGNGEDNSFLNGGEFLPDFNSTRISIDDDLHVAFETFNNSQKENSFDTSVTETPVQVRKQINIIATPDSIGSPKEDLSGRF